MEGSVIAVGTFIAYWIDFGLSYVESSSVQWRFPLAFQIFFAIVLFFAMSTMPESPRWLIAQNRMKDALYVLAALKGSTTEDKEIHTEARIALEAVHEAGDEGGFKDLFTSGPTQHLRRMLLGASTQ